MTLLIEREIVEDVTVREYETSRPVRLGAPALAVLNDLPTGRLDVRPTTDPGWFVLRAGSWVGSIVMPDMTVRIHPKVKDLRTVLMMFSASSGQVDWRPDQLGYGTADLVEGVAELVLRSIDAVTRRGLVHGYRATEERLPVIRGRVDVQQLASRPWDTWPVPCRYDDFTADIAENRVLLATVKQLGRLARQSDSRRVAGDLVQRLGEVGDAAHPIHELDQVKLTPVNEHYSGGLGLCRLVLEGIGLTHGAGGHQAVTFLVDMNKLYERWIGAELTQRLWPELEVDEQAPVPLSKKPPVTMAPDLVFRRGGRTMAVADVKYKLTDDGLGRTPDYYQLLAYATALELPAGLLIYCRADQAPERVITVVGGGQRLHSQPVDLSGDWSDVSASLDTLAASIRTLTTAQTQGATT
jgi:5-methylcytosine-specific restriction enzyme subunit McrC